MSEQRVIKQAAIGHMLEALVHKQFTCDADDLFVQGAITRDERLALSAAIGQALTVFNEMVRRTAPRLHGQATLPRPYLPGVPASVSSLAPIDMPTLYPAVNKGEVVKADDDQQLVFGWASISTTQEGELVVDSQGDMIEPHELEQAVYRFMHEYADKGAGELHTGEPLGHIVESVVVTPEKSVAMGLPGTHTGWWIGQKIDDPDAFQKVKSGEYRMFSIQGRAVREKA